MAVMDGRRSVTRILLHLMATVMRMTRTMMLEVLRQDYVRTARAKGAGEQLVVYRHALRNALIPVVTIVGLQFGTLLGGAVITETIFAWPGVGRLAIQSIYVRDYPVVQAAVFSVSIGFVVINLLVDITYAYLDPRIRLTANRRREQQAGREPNRDGDGGDGRAA